jgi:hypothetical protein
MRVQHKNQKKRKKVELGVRNTVKIATYTGLISYIPRSIMRNQKFFKVKEMSFAGAEFTASF